MKVFSSFFVVVWFAVFCNRSTGEEFALTDGLLISGATVLSPERATTLTNGHVVVDRERIVYVGEEEPQLTGKYQTINAEGKYLIPGLIDSHVHVSSAPGFGDDVAITHPELKQMFFRQQPRSFLYFGFTTLIDLGAVSLEGIETFSSQPLNPDLYYVGNGAVIGEGYGAVNWDKKPASFIAVNDSDKNPAFPFDKHQQTPEAVVERLADSGPIAIKSYYEPGWWPGADLPVPTLEMVESLKQATHNRHLILTMHGNSSRAHELLSEADIDVVAHGLWNWGGARLDNEQVPTAIRNILDKHIENGIAYTPSMRVLHGIRAMADAEFLNDPELAHVWPAKVLAYYQAEQDRIYRDEFGDEPKVSTYAGLSYGISRGAAALNYMVDNGGNVIFGTDTPSSPTYGNPPGYNGYLELRAMHEAGVGLDSILEIATINTARAYNLEHDHGSIEKGKVANLLLLSKNPLEDTTAYDSIDVVVVRGKAVKRNILRAN